MLICRHSGVSVSGDHDQRAHVLGEVLLQNRREHNVRVRRGPDAERGADAQVSQERQVVQRDSHLRSRFGRNVDSSTHTHNAYLVK